MKTIKHITLALIMAGAALGLTLSSCQKSFDPKLELDLFMVGHVSFKIAVSRFEKCGPLPYTFVEF